MRSRRAEPHRLDGLERWLQERIVAPHEREAGRARARSSTGAEARAVVLPSRTLAPAERVAIYADSYFIRLRECLEIDYPAVRVLLGEAAFARLARAYLNRHPSRHYSLGALGAKLPDFLSGPVRVPRKGLVRDVARLERAMEEVFDAPPSPVLESRELAKVPPDRWPQVSLLPIGAFALLALAHPANAIVTAVKREERLPPLVRRPSWIAVYRRSYAVVRMDLTEPMFVLLAELARGRPIGRALNALARRFPDRLEALEPQVFAWFKDWVQEGLFQALSIVPPARRGKRARTE